MSNQCQHCKENGSYSPYKALPKWTLTPGNTGMSPMAQVIFNYYHSYHNACTKKLSNVLQDLNMSQYEFYKYRKELEKSNWLLVDQRSEDGKGRVSSEVRVNQAKVMEIDSKFAKLQSNGCNCDLSQKIEDTLSQKIEDTLSQNSLDHSINALSNSELSNKDRPAADPVREVANAQNPPAPATPPVPDLEPLPMRWASEADKQDVIRANIQLFKVMRSVLKPTQTLKNRFPEFVEAHPTATPQDVIEWVERDWPRHKFFNEEKPPLGTLINDFSKPCDSKQANEKHVKDWLDGKKPLKDLPTSLQIAVKSSGVHKFGMLESEVPAAMRKILKHAK